MPDSSARNNNHPHMAILNKQRRHTAASTLIGLGVFALSLTILWRALPRPQFEPLLWTAESGAPVPDTFSYAMFPKGTHMTLFDQPDGVPDSTLHHATICTERQRRAGGFLPVHTTSGIRYAKFSELTFAAMSESFSPFESLVFRSADENQRITLSQRLASSGTQNFVLRLGDGKHPRERVYVWDVSNSVPTPREIRQSDFMTAINVGLFAASGIALSIVPGVLASNVYNRRARLAHEKAPVVGAL